MKGIGFKSVFRVTDTPEIHSNGFHIKFDITDDQIGLVLPAIVPPCDINHFTNLVSFDTSTDQVKSTHDYNTCIVLPLKSKSTETSTEENIKSMFADLHPSLLLFLHRLQCIKFRDMLNDSFVIMRKQITGNGLINVSIRNETLTWFVDSRELQANGIRNDVKTTEISVLFDLKVSGNGNYIPKLDQQHVFAFLPLQTHGLKFIIYEVYNKAYILTNHGFALPSEVEIHFGNELGNHIDISRLISGIDVKWYEVDNTYMMYPPGVSMLSWRNFLKEVGITDFVQTVRVKNTIPVSSQVVLTNMMWEKMITPPGSTINDWESRELVDLLAKVSLSGDGEKCKHLLEVLDEIWDEYYTDKAVAYCNRNGESKAFKSSLVSALGDVQWVVSSVDNGLLLSKGFVL